MVVEIDDGAGKNVFPDMRKLTTPLGELIPEPKWDSSAGQKDVSHSSRIYVIMTSIIISSLEKGARRQHKSDRSSWYVCRQIMCIIWNIITFSEGL